MSEKIDIRYLYKVCENIPYFYSLDIINCLRRFADTETTETQQRIFQLIAELQKIKP